MAASFNKFNTFVADVGNKVHNLGSDAIWIELTNSAPSAANTVIVDITDITAANGYSAGGAVIGSTAYSQVSGTAKLTGNAVVYTASGGTIGPFRYSVLYNHTAAGGPLIGWWDYGSSVTLNANETFTANSAVNGNWDSTNPILILA